MVVTRAQPSHCHSDMTNRITDLVWRDRLRARRRSIALTTCFPVIVCPVNAETRRVYVKRGPITRDTCVIRVRRLRQTCRLSWTFYQSDSVHTFYNSVARVVCKFGRSILVKESNFSPRMIIIAWRQFASGRWKKIDVYFCRDICNTRKLSLTINDINSKWNGY